jgi:hypothetical protein
MPTAIPRWAITAGRAEFRCGRDLRLRNLRDAGVGATTTATPARWRGWFPCPARRRLPAGEAWHPRPASRQRRISRETGGRSSPSGASVAGKELSNANRLIVSTGRSRSARLSRPRFPRFWRWEREGHGVDLPPGRLPRDRLEGVAAAPDGPASGCLSAKSARPERLTERTERPHVSQPGGLLPGQGPAGVSISASGPPISRGYCAPHRS